MTRRTTMDVDDDLLARAREVLGTSGLRDTVDAALRAAVRQSLRRRLARRVTEGTGIDRGPELLERVRPRAQRVASPPLTSAAGPVGPAPSL